jgi:hypothetical protein
MLIITVIFSILFFSCQKKEEKVVQQKNETIGIVNKIEIKKIDTIAINFDNVQKAEISKSDSLISIYQSWEKDFRIFGYKLPNEKSEKLILFSPFTDEVENNPFQCKFGSHYDYVSFKPKMKFIKYENDFAKIKILDSTFVPNFFFIQKKWIEFEE